MNKDKMEERSRADRRAKTKTWAVRRIDRPGSKCGNPKCGVCAPHKRWKNTSRFDNKTQRISKELKKLLKKIC